MDRMLSLYRRHTAKCPHRAKGREYSKCSCPLWCDGMIDFVRIHKSLGTRDSKVANLRARDLELNKGVESEHEQAVTIAGALEAYEADAKARNLAPETLRKYGQSLAQFKEYCKEKGVHSPRQLTLDLIREYRGTWKFQPITQQKALERLRSILAFFVANSWMPENYAKKLRPPKVEGAPTLPYTQEEMVKLLAACETYPFANAYVRRQTRTFILLLRYSGLRLLDTVQFNRERVDASGRLLLTMEKTGVPLRFPLPAFVVTALEEIRQADGYFFRSGPGTWKSQESGWWRRLKKLGKHAGVVGVRPHRFRDTFAVELLNAGVSIETVSKLLGHKSIRVTEKHYSPWVASRQAELEKALGIALASDTLLLQILDGSKKSEENQQVGVVAREGIEPPTRGFSVRCSTN